MKGGVLMIKRISLVALLVCLVVSLFLVPACSQSPSTSAPPVTSGSAAANKTPIKIGALLDFTGFSSANYEGMKTALDIKMAEIGGTWMGRPVQLIAEDSGSDPTISTDKCRKFVESDKVDVVLGPLTGTDAVASYLSQSKTPNVIYMALPKTCLGFGGGNIFMPFGTDLCQGYYMGDYLAAQGYKTITCLHDDFAAGENFLTALIAAFEAKGGKSIQRQRTTPGANDYAANITSMQKADAVAFWLTPASAQRFMQQYSTSGLKMPLAIPCCNVIFRSTMAAVGDGAIGMVGTQVYSRLSTSPANVAWLKAYSDKTGGKQPESEFTSAYIAISLFLEAVKQTNGDTSHAAINAAMQKVKLDTPGGVFSFTTNGLGVGDMNVQQVVKVADGGYDWKNVKPYSQIPLDVPTK
jgi:branched-chain amino acid transport system substrate-binding protein